MHLRLNICQTGDSQSPNSSPNPSPLKHSAIKHVNDWHVY